MTACQMTSVTRFLRHTDKGDASKAGRCATRKVLTSHHENPIPTAKKNGEWAIYIDVNDDR